MHRNNMVIEKWRPFFMFWNHYRLKGAVPVARGAEPRSCHCRRLWQFLLCSRSLLLILLLSSHGNQSGSEKWSMTSFSFVLANIVLLLKSIIFVSHLHRKFYRVKKNDTIVLNVYSQESGPCHQKTTLCKNPFFSW